jgi:hypothetical protein
MDGRPWHNVVREDGALFLPISILILHEIIEAQGMKLRTEKGCLRM